MSLRTGPPGSTRPPLGVTRGGGDLEVLDRLDLRARRLGRGRAHLVGLPVVGAESRVHAGLLSWLANPVGFLQRSPLGRESRDEFRSRANIGDAADVHSGV